MADTLAPDPTNGRPTNGCIPLAERLADALDRGAAALDGSSWCEPAGPRDRLLTLHLIHDLHTAPLGRIGDRVRWQHHPVVARLKTRLEAEWVEHLDAHTGAEAAPGPATAAGTADAMRRLAARDRSPSIYRWLANEAPWPEALQFLALEGGPDDVFDDLVALCQVGLPLGAAKMELAGNYWDEMGNGEFDKVHNVLYRRFVTSVGLPDIPIEDHPLEALERAAVLGLLASNRALQPEMIGALGLIELEAGPHCRYVDQGLGRLGASDEAREFYRIHAVVDPLHGQGWLEHAVTPLVDHEPAWGPRILRGARWKSHVNNRFFDWAERNLPAQLLCDEEPFLLPAKALAQYGIPEGSYAGDEEMFDLVHRVRTRIMTSPAFTGDRILGAILFEGTMDREVAGSPTARYLWGVKRVVPFLKVDQGLAEPADGVQLMKPIDGLDELLARAGATGVFGTKMRSVAKLANPSGIERLVAQQFEVAAQILTADLVPIIEPEVDITSPEKAPAEALLRASLASHLDSLPDGQQVMLKLSIPSEDDAYAALIAHPAVLRVVALSGGYPRDEANERLTRNPGLIASFSRALIEDLSADHTDEAFDAALGTTIGSIYQASIT